MQFELMTDKDVVAALGERFDKVRRHKHIQDKELLAASGTSSAVLAKFRKGGNINLESFVKLMRGIGELEALEKLLHVPESFSPTGENKKIPQRIRKSKEDEKNFQWGDEQ